MWCRSRRRAKNPSRHKPARVFHPREGPPRVSAGRQVEGSSEPSLDPCARERGPRSLSPASTAALVRPGESAPARRPRHHRAAAHAGPRPAADRGPSADRRTPRPRATRGQFLCQELAALGPAPGSDSDLFGVEILREVVHRRTLEDLSRTTFGRKIGLAGTVCSDQSTLQMADLAKSLSE